MKYRFSIKGLFVVTTVVSVLMALAMWLGMFSGNHWTVAALVVYFLVYLAIAGVCFGPRYVREWKEFRANLGKHKVTRSRLESEAQELLDAINADASEAQQAPEEFEG